MKINRIFAKLVLAMALHTLYGTAHCIEPEPAGNDISPEQQRYDNFGRGSVYFELFGSGAIYSVGYDKIFGRPGDLVRFTLAGGVTAYTDFNWFFNIYLTPQINCLVGSEKHSFELGIGPNIPLSKEPRYLFDIAKPFCDYYYISFFRVGYRYSLNSKLYFRVAFTPYYVVSSGPYLYGVRPWGGFTVGWFL